MYKLLIKPILFLFPPEQAHHITISLLKAICRLPFTRAIFKKIYGVKNKSLNREVMGIDFPNPVGLAAGFDKDASFINEMAMLGFGFIEIGTVTPQAQDGNPKPRLFRLPKDEALINRMGFNNQGVDSMVQRLKKLKKSNVIIGGNIGKNKVTPNEKAINDYLICFSALFEYVDYFAVNVSSPNTPNLRALQDKAPLTALLSRLQTENQNKPKPKPILLKIAPDLNENQLKDIIDIVKETKLNGVIATNTTIGRTGLQSVKNITNEKGGLSGKPVKRKSTEVISFLRKELGTNYVIIGVGGVHDPDDAIEKLTAGADLIQIYTGMVYEGPSLIKRINKAIIERS